MQIQSWQMTEPKLAMSTARRELDESSLTGDQALVEVAGCGVCHTDLGFLYDGVRTRHELPLTLGHEIAGRVVAAGPDAQDWMGKAVVVPAVIPCGECAACKKGRGAICGDQFFPGNDDHGGFASHVVVPGRGLCAVDEARLASAGIELATLSVVADAVTTPYQAIVNADLEEGDVAIFIGVGGVGNFGVQIAKHMGAHVVAIDVDEARLAAMHAAELKITSSDDLRGIKKQIRGWVKENGYATTGWKIFETSGHPAGQALAFSLLGYDAHLAVVGYTREKIPVRLSNLMAFDATMRGTWGCLPEHYPAVVDMVLSGAVDLSEVTESRPMSRINETFDELHRHALKRRPVLIPDFS
ncbi:MAG: 6-hydroxycyclohex-1-ene-1-carbonyl-CoA dehydrogenase [Proteobacteria bacterium]|nr:6-hydroxycyclohex-1-ene-1-carbonyl-CoA dehydrogenase [Pseudomonadota bacterium]MCP4919398.1 6-hydroxycyclohex-1-ene-1-carbonyl-CoA dehydrogenase [Pseudomonadota bacterium]